VDQAKFATRARGEADSSLKEVLESFPGVISFAGGLPDEKAFPVDELAKIVQETSRDPAAWQYLPTEGHPALREAIARHMADLGVEAGPENVLITQGSQQGLDLVAKLFVDPGDHVLMEAPGYLGAIGAAQNYEAEIWDVPVGDDGLDLERLREAPGGAKYLYTVSTFHNPTGCSIPLARRPQILEIASAKGFYIVEDGAYRELCFEGRPDPPLKSFDREGRVIYLGSFSKALVPGVRVGWIVAAPQIIRTLALLKQSTDLASNTLGQLFVLRWLETHGLTPPVDLYRKKRDSALNALEREMPAGVSWNRPKGGFFPMDPAP